MRRSSIVGIVVFSCLFLLTQYISYQQYLIRKEAEQQHVERELQAVKDRLTTAIGYSRSSVKTLAFIVAEYGVPQNFDSVASSILQSARYIDAIQLTQKGVITHIYPYKGNEAAIGFDIMSDNATRNEANRAIRKRELFFAGPLELRQGGKGVVGRFPIFKKNEFQGFAAVVIKLTTLLKAIGIDTTQQGEFRYQLSKINPTTHQEEYFLPQSFDTGQGESATLHVPAGDWKIMVMTNRRQRLFFNIAFSIVGLILSFTGGAFAWYLVRQPEKLRQLVAEKTALVIDSQNQFRTTLERVSDGFISYDREWRYRYINAAAEQVLGINQSELIGKNIWEEFPELKDKPIYDAYNKAIADQRYVYVESYLPNHAKWFKNHLYPSPDGLSVFFRDITQQKKSEQAIILAYKEKEAVLQRISDSVISLDTEWRYTFLNDAALEDVPFGREGTLGKVIWDVHPELHGTFISEKYREAVKNMQTVAFESFYEPMKKWFAIRCYPSQDGLTIFYQNITEKKEKDKLIEINEASLMEAQSVANVGSWETNLTSLQVIWSLQTFHIFELNPATFKPTHTTFLDFVHPDERDKVDKAFAESFQYDGWCNIEHRIVTHSGQVKWVEERWRVFKNEQHVPYRATGTCQDITKRKVAEIEKTLLLYNTEESFILLDNNLSIISFNNQFYNLYEQHFGFKVEKNKSMLDYAQPDRKEILKDIYANVLAGKTEEAEFSFSLPDGSAKIFSIKYKPARNETNEVIGVFVTKRDITERKKAEELLRTSEARARKIFESDMIGFIFWDAQGEILDANDYFLQMVGYTRQELNESKIRWSEMTPPEYANLDQDGLNQIMTTNICKPFQKEYIRKDGTRVPVLLGAAGFEAGSAEKGVSYIMDITELKSAENQIRKTNEKLIEAQLVANVGSWETDLVTQQVVWSLQTYHIFELDPATFKLTSTTVLDFIHPQDLDKVNKDFAESFSRDDRCVNEHRIITQNGKEKWLELKWQVFKNEQQEPYRAAGTCQDITKRKVAENELLVYAEEIKRLTAHLEQVREDERTRIAREVHDELGQQLTGLKMDASWLLKRISAEQTIIHEKLSGMLSLMDHTIKTIRRISSDLRPGILDDLGLVAALEWQSTEFEKQYEIACVFKSEVGDLQPERQLATTAFRIYQEALTNVLRHAQATRVESILERTATHIILTVKDNGQGFDDKELKSKGTLGLIGMRERALMVGTELTIESKKGAGTIIKLKIPLALVAPPPI